MKFYSILLVPLHLWLNTKQLYDVKNTKIHIIILTTIQSSITVIKYDFTNVYFTKRQTLNEVLLNSPNLSYLFCHHRDPTINMYTQVIWCRERYKYTHQHKRHYFLISTESSIKTT